MRSEAAPWVHGIFLLKPFSFLEEEAKEEFPEETTFFPKDLLLKIGAVSYKTILAFVAPS